MGMGSIPCNAWTITLAGLKAICPGEVEACEMAFQRHGYNWDSFARAMHHEEFDDIPDDADPQDMVNAWETLQAAFKKVTAVGASCLELGIGHYCRDDGDRYDELEEGCYFTVDGVVQLTPAGERFKEHLEVKSWTVFG
jgi:hypothetical protein